MAGSLRDQLVKAGLATGAQAKKAERQQRAEAQAKKHADKGKGKQSKPTAPGAAEQVRARAKTHQAEKAAKDRELAKQHNDKYAARALRAEIKQIILLHDQRVKAPDDDAVPYNFVHGKRIKKLYVTRVQQDALSNGRLLVVNNDGNYHFLQPPAAAKIAERDPKRIIVAHGGDATSAEEDEYYAKFKVPDDLDW